MVAAALAREAGFALHALTVDYGQRHRIELEAAARIAAALGAARHVVLPLESLLWRLFHEDEEVRVLAAVPLRKGCRCSYDYVRAVIARFGPEERAEMADDEGFISVDCEFCSRVFPIKLGDLDAETPEAR